MIFHIIPNHLTRCYVEKEMKQREDLGIDSEAVMKDNQKLAEIG